MNALKRGSKGKYSDGREKPLSTLISFNVSDEILNFKIYSELFRNTFTDEEILRFIPSTVEFKKYLKFWDDSKPSSLCFGIKIDKNLVPTNYTYLKLKFEGEIVDQFKTNDLGLNYTSDFVGIAYEYKNGKTVEKKYWYYDDVDNIQKIITRFNLQSEVLDHPIYHIEYTEFASGESKIIIVYDYYNSIHANSSFLDDLIHSSFSDTTKNLVWFMKNEFCLEPRYFGVYDKNITSLYWSLTGKELDNPHLMLNIHSYNT